MNRGSVPGFYYDEAKNKFFRIQAHHIAPRDAKYSRSNVKREQRETKRRKKDREQQQVRQRQTVTRSNVLQHAAIGGIGVLREHGTQRLTDLRNEHDSFLCSQLQAEYMWPGDCNFLHNADTHVQDLHFSNHTSSALMAFRPNDSRSFSYYGARLPLGTNNSVYPSDHWTSSPNLAPAATRVEAFFSTIISTSLSWSTSHAAEGMLVCAQSPHRLGNVHLSYAREADAYSSPATSIRLCLGNQTNHLWASAFRDGADLAAIAGSEDIFVIDHEGKVAHRLRLASESRAVAWLDHNLLAYGQHIVSAEPSPRPSANNNNDRGLMLWDLRTSGRVLRFPRPAPITGLLAPSGSQGGLHIVATTNHSIALFDTRAPSLPLLSFAHTHQGPQCQFTTAGPKNASLLAAVDRDNRVQIYSTRTGKSVRTLTPPSSPDGHGGGAQGPLVRGLKWYEDLDGAGDMLVGCQGPRIVRWGVGDGV
nr:hypothetical protein CFP56_64116 [Quercus suber]